MAAHVRFVDRFVSRVELTRWLESADVFVTPYPNMDQIVSGTLSYAMGAGRAIVSTPYTYAAELLANGRGVLVPPASPTGARRCHRHPARRRRAAQGRRHGAHTSTADRWSGPRSAPTIDGSSTASQGSCHPRSCLDSWWPRMPEMRPLPRRPDASRGPRRPHRDHAACGGLHPGPRSWVLRRRRRAGAPGRPAALAAARLGRDRAQCATLPDVPVRGVRPGRLDASVTSGGWTGRGWTNAHPRIARGVPCMRSGMPSRPLQSRPSPRTARTLFERALPATDEIGALRAISSVALGCEAAIRGGSSGAVERIFGSMADRLRTAFDPGLASEWPWPEPVVTYENGLPVRALIVAGQHHGEPSMIQAGVGALEWLIAAQTTPDGHLSPVGNGWWQREGPRSRFDQQPIEATTLMLAAEAAYQATGDCPVARGHGGRLRLVPRRERPGHTGRRPRSGRLLRRIDARWRQPQPGRRVDAHVALGAGAHARCPSGASPPTASPRARAMASVA